MPTSSRSVSVLERCCSSRAVAATMPLALTMVSGAQMMPRVWSSSAVLSASSWLLAGPTMVRQRHGLAATVIQVG